MDVAQIVSMAKAFLPKNSPWIAKIEQAQQMAGRFAQSPSGVQDLMRELGKNQQDIQSAIAALSSPAVSGVMRRFSPGLYESLKSAGNALSSPAGNAAPPPQVGDSLSSLRDKISRL